MEDRSVRTAEAGLAELESAERGTRVLLVDDDVHFTVVASLMLRQRCHFDVQVLNDPTEAVRAAESWKPDLILLDYVMPGMDGGEVFQALKSHAPTKHIPVIILTALVDDDTPLELGLRSGRLTMAKPVRTDALIKNIRALVKQESVEVASYS